MLRGRDIKKYSYEFADKYLIATFPSKQYRIENFPAVKRFLSGFRPKIDQVGRKLHKEEKEKILNHAQQYGIDISMNMLSSSRKYTRNQWFETQDSISYWEDFFKPKIMYSEIVKDSQFYFDNHGYFFPEATTFIMTGDGVEKLQHILNSKCMTYIFKTFYAGGGLGADGFRYKKTFIQNLPIPSSIKTLSVSIQTIDNILFSLYHFNKEEITFIINELI
nr:TaqI-like C-terminal specificity domain-containing protein [Pelistega sp. MC2]